MSILWAILTQNPIARLIGKIVGLALLILTFGAWQRRQGAHGAKAKRDIQDLKGFKKTTERMQDADAAMGDDPDALREWLRQRDADKP